jgi:hypothetical protein
MVARDWPLAKVWVRGAMKKEKQNEARAVGKN